MSENGAPLVELIDVEKEFPIRRSAFGRVESRLRAVDGVSLAIAPGETLGLVGESGCGKSTLGRLALRLLRPTRGRVRFDGRDLDALGREELRRLRSEMQIVFQDPYSSLNPRLSVGASIDEGLAAHGFEDRPARTARALEEVGLAADAAPRFPHEFSGGQRQRIGIARAIALEPRFIVCDEPVSALDVSIQAQILELLARLKSSRGIAYLFISHDLSVVRAISDRVAVMYAGRVVELAPRDDLYSSALHPYTRALLAAVPIPDPAVERKLEVTGDAPSTIERPAGCAFHPRCPIAIPGRCDRDDPPLVDSGGRSVACPPALE